MLLISILPANMSNFYLKPLSQSNTPVKRLGLSRKRKSSLFTKASSYPESPTSAISGTADQSPSDSKMKKLESTDCLKSPEESQNEQDVKSKTESQSNLKKVKNPDCKGNGMKSVRDKMKDLESLYLIWKDGFKNSILYLVKHLQERQGEPVDLRKVLSDLRILEKVKGHFKNDPDLDIFTYDE